MRGSPTSRPDCFPNLSPNAPFSCSLLVFRCVTRRCLISPAEGAAGHCTCNVLTFKGKKLIQKEHLSHHLLTLMPSKMYMTSFLKVWLILLALKVVTNTAMQLLLSKSMRLGYLQYYYVQSIFTILVIMFNNISLFMSVLET